METIKHFWSYLAQFYLEWEMFETKVIWEIKTQIFCSIIFFWKSWLLRDNLKKIVEPDRPQMTVWRIRTPCWIPKATNTHTHTHSLCNTHCFFIATVVARKRLSLTLYVLCLSCFFIIWDTKFYVDTYCTRPNKRAWGCDTNHSWAISEKRNSDFLTRTWKLLCR